MAEQAETSRPDDTDEQGVQCDVPYRECLRWSRELQFRPSDPRRGLKVLSADQVEFYNNSGYLKGLPVLSADDVRQWQGLWAEMRQAENVGPLGVNAFHTKYSAVHDLCCHPALAAYATDLLGPDVVCWGVQQTTSFFWPLATSPEQTFVHTSAQCPTRGTGSWRGPTT